MKNKFCILPLLWGFFLTLSAQEKLPAFELDSVYSYFEKQLYTYPQEKIYAQLDKPSYIAGEDIWFRAHIVNAAWHMPDTLSRYLYVELINPKKELEQRIKVRIENGALYGHVPLSAELREGEYQLRFYTRFMEGLGEEYFFRRNVRIGTLAPAPVEKEEKQKKSKEAYHVSFFPEGGAMPHHTITVVGFKALNPDGLGEDITGVIVNQKGDTISQFRSAHRGMGSFSCVASPGDKLTAICENRDGIEHRFEFPAAEADAIALQVVRRRGKIYISVNHTPERTIPQGLNLMVITRAGVVFSTEWQEGMETVAVNDDALLPGVVQILLADASGEPVSERLIFNAIIDNPAVASISTSKDFYKGREHVELGVWVTDKDGDPLTGDFSISITDDRDVLPDSCVNILSTLLLTSELKGHIESPAFYFRNTNNQTLHLLDNLMLTQGWSRYRISDVIKGEIQTAPRLKEWSSEISGKVKGGLLMTKKGEGYPVTLLCMDPMGILETEADETGTYRFSNFDFPDSLEFIIQAKTPKGGTRVEITYDEESFPSLNIFSPPPFRGDRDDFNQYLKKADNQLLLSKGIRTIHLGDVVVKAPYKEPTGRSKYSSAFNHIVSEEQLSKRTYTSIYDLLRSLPGVTVTGEKVMLSRNMSTGQEVLIMVDDLMLDQEHLVGLMPEDVAEIELVRDAGTVILGPRASGGAILITTKRGEGVVSQRENFHIKNIKPLGVQRTKEFYSPVYDVKENSEFINPDLRTTIYWNPVVRTDEFGEANVNFYTAESFKTYSVVIEGVTSDGRIIYLQEQIKGGSE